MTDFRLKNTNLNTTEFMLINATENNYQYHFSLNLHTQLHYQLDMLVFSGNSSKQWHFNISKLLKVKLHIFFMSHNFVVEWNPL